MSDVVYLLVTLVSFGLLALLVGVLDRSQNRSQIRSQSRSDEA